MTVKNPDEIYDRITWMDVCFTVSAIEDVLPHLGPSNCYTINITPYNYEFAKRLARGFVQNQTENPFMPQVNIVLNEGLKLYEWFIEANGKRIGLKGL